jgi:soluble lytic murein transglycosylase-like protein
MRRKLSGYFLLSFFSFCFFTFVFLAIANVQAKADQPDLQTPVANQQQVMLPPTPTIYNEQLLQQPSSTQQNIPSPTPTVYIAPDSQISTPVTSTPLQQNNTANIQITQTVPVTPTATPAPTETPTPTTIPVPTATPLLTQVPQPSSSDLDALFNQYGTTYNVSPAELEKIAQCESGFNTNSDTGTYAGMFQFSEATWESTRTTMGLDPNPDLRKNPEEAIKTAAFMLSRGEENAWPNCH